MSDPCLLAFALHCRSTTLNVEYNQLDRLLLPPCTAHNCPLLPGLWLVSLVCLHCRSTTLNVEYNQLDPLLRATTSPQGDANDDTGFSPFPGGRMALAA